MNLKNRQLLVLLLLLLPLLAVRPQAGNVKAPASLRPGWDGLSLSFVPNAGQTDAAVRFQVHSMGGTVFFAPDQMVLSLPGLQQRQGTQAGLLARFWQNSEHAFPPAVVRVRFEGAHSAPHIQGIERLPGVVNYFIGDDPAEWYTNVPTYRGVVYHGLYPGIDLRYDGEGGVLKGTYSVAPGADPGHIQLAFEGIDGIELDERGNLVLHVPGGEIRQEAPYLYQEIDGVQRAVAGGYVFRGERLVGFQIASYDVTQPLIIDPSLGYSTYLGGSGSDGGSSIAVDAAFNVYVTGATGSTDFPTKNPLQSSHAGGDGDVFITKLASSGQGGGIIYSTFLGGNDSDRGKAIAVDDAGNVYVAGSTESSNFPTTSGAFDRSFGEGSFAEDGFVVKLNSTGSELVYATFLGGSMPDAAQAIAVNDEGFAFVTGFTRSNDFPTQNPYQDSPKNEQQYAEAFVTKLNQAGSELVYSTYLGGDEGADGYGIAVDDSGNVYVTGGTGSSDFPTKSPFQAALAGGSDAFVTKFDSSGGTLLYSTYLGGANNDYGLAIALDVTGNAHVAGMTSSYNFPTVRAVQPTFAGVWDTFVAQLNATGSGLNYATFLGGSQDERLNGIALGPFRDVYVVGETRSTDFPTAAPDQAANAGAYDVFIAKLRSTGWGLAYSTYLGGSGSDYGQGVAVDRAGNAHVTGSTYSSDFPITPGALDNSYSQAEAFVVRISNVVGTLVGYIPSTGGKLESPEQGLSLVFPSGAFTQSILLTSSFLEADQYTGELAGIGSTFDLTAVYSGTGQLARLVSGQTCQVTLQYTDAGRGGAIEDTLALYNWDGSGWVKEPTSQVDTEANVVSASVDHFSMWAVLGEARRVYLPLIVRNG